MRKAGLSDKKAVQFVTKLFKNVVSQDSSGSNAANTFFSGKGDVLITYESEAYAAFAAGKQGKLVVPKPTMLIQLPMVATKSAPAAAKAFISYAHGPKQQKIFAANGYRPVVKSVLKSSDMKNWRKKYDTGPTFNIDDKLFRGWRHVDKVWFDLTTGRMVAIEQAVGGPTH
jgi:sulfate transport system substrate-binding protein